MPATYSISVGTPTEALRKQDINSVLLDLPDNTQKLISPKDVRDAFVTTWANSAFKQTIGQANIEYLGIDSGNPNNRDIKQKIFIGKRNYAGLDIMNNVLLNDTNNDIYIYNDDIYNIYDMILQTLLFVSIPIIIALYFQNKKHKNNKLNSVDETTIDETTIDETTIDKTTIDETTIDKTTIDKTTIDKTKTNLHLDSINELMNQNELIMSKLTLNNNYIVLLRIKMKNNLLIHKTKYDIKSKQNNNNNNHFTTKDMYMLFNFTFQNHNPCFANIIISCINSLNQLSNEKYKNEDFVVIAIGNLYNNPYELYNGFINVNYELFNVKEITNNIDNTKYIKYLLTLPVKDVHNMILDIFKDTIFESKLYSINSKNDETWNGIPLN